MTDTPGLLAEFRSADAIRSAVRAADKAGYTRLDAFSPFPMPDIAQCLGHRPLVIPAIAIAAGMFGAAIQYCAQYWMNVVDYPINVGGRPLHAWPAFVPATLIVGILWAAAASLIGMFVVNGLPRLHHPLFDAAGFERVSKDRFFLFIDKDDPKFDAVETKHFLERHEAVRVQEVSSR